ncbi:MAG: hypothetical protein E6J41_00755 [Chloroflexi bacterium]|nr:MAG: hypothetical protein E6J41_00755 [Chloroflexota bacterium]
MIEGIVWGTRLRRAAVALAILAGSQLGHAIVYYARFGAGAAGRQATGVHAYFPALTGALSAALGGTALAVLLAVAAARSLAPGPAARRIRPTARFFDLLPALFAAQVLVFAGQETIESLAAGAPVPSVGELLFWAALGQLPAAAVAAAALTWLLARLESVWTALVDGVARLLGEPWTPAPARPLGLQPAPALRLASAFPAAFHKRGPPSCSNR